MDAVHLRGRRQRGRSASRCGVARAGHGCAAACAGCAGILSGLVVRGGAGPRGGVSSLGRSRNLVLFTSHADEEHSALELADDEDGAAVELDGRGGGLGAGTVVCAGGASSAGGATSAAAAFASVVGVGGVGRGRAAHFPERGGDGALAAEDTCGQVASVHEEVSGGSGQDGGAKEVGEIGAQKGSDALGEEERRGKRQHAGRRRNHVGRKRHDRDVGVKRGIVRVVVVDGVT